MIYYLELKLNQQQGNDEIDSVFGECLQIFISFAFVFLVCLQIYMSSRNENNFF